MQSLCIKQLPFCWEVCVYTPSSSGQGSVAAGSQISVALKYPGFNYKKFHPINPIYSMCRPKLISYCLHKFYLLQQVPGEDPKSSEAFSWLETGHSLLGQGEGVSSSHCARKGSWQECGFYTSKRDLLNFVSLESSSNAQQLYTPQKGHGTPGVGQHRLESSSLIHPCSSREHLLPG